eukprot:4578583-Amphidinium_carterae.1
MPRCATWFHFRSRGSVARCQGRCNASAVLSKAAKPRKAFSLSSLARLELARSKRQRWLALGTAAKAASASKSRRLLPPKARSLRLLYSTAESFCITLRLNFWDLFSLLGPPSPPSAGQQHSDRSEGTP